MSTDLIKINAADFGLEETKAAQIEAQFKPMLEKMVELEIECNQVITMPIDTKEASEAARKLRLKYVKVRTGTDAIHKQQKSFYIAGGKFVDGWRNAQAFASQGIEEKLNYIENYHVIKERERINELEAVRREELLPYGTVLPAMLGELPDEVYQNYLAGVKMAHTAKIEAEKKAAQDKADAEKAAEEKRKQEELELEKLKSEAIAAEIKLIAEKKKAEVERQAIEAKAAAERKAIEDKAKAEKAKAEADIARQKAEIQKLADELARQALEKRKQQERWDAEDKQKADAIKAAEEKAKQAPESLKLKLLASKFVLIKDQLPEGFTSEAGLKAINDIRVTCVKVVDYLNKIADSL